MAEENKGGTPPAWMAQLPDDLKDNEALTRHETIGDLGKSYVDLNGRIDNSVQLLGEDATDEDRATFYNKTGRPETPDGYELPEPQLPEGMPYDKEREKKYRKKIHDLGLSKAVGEKLFKTYNDEAVEVFGDLQAQRKKYHDDQVGALQGKWGNDYSANTENAMAIAQEHGGEDFVKFLDSSGLGDNPRLVEFCFNISSEIAKLKGLIGEDALLTGSRAGGAGEKSPADKLYPEMASKEGG